MVRIGLVGFGAIGSVVARALVARTHGLASSSAVLDSILVRTARATRPEGLGEDVLITADRDAFFARPFDVLVECAGQQSVRDMGEQALASGRSIIVTSIGVFTNDAFYKKLGDCAAANGTKLYLASGAMPALDWTGSTAGPGTGRSPWFVQFDFKKPKVLARQDSAEDFCRLNARRCTAMDWIFILAYCFAIP